MTNILVIEDGELSKTYEKRYVIIDKDTGEILDNAQGYGYKSANNAYKAYYYKKRDKKKENQIKQWMKEHKGFINALNQFAFEIAKGSWAPDEKIDAQFVEQMLENYGLSIDFTASELLRVWRRW